jgi:glycosyltransferase involved in cell wall biosynthesis
VCRNSRPTLARALESVLQQEYPCVEHVVVDGMSSDGTVELIREYEERFHSMGLGFRWVSEPDGGIYDAMNKGVARATGDAIGILNSDDFYEPGTFQAIADAFASHPDAGIAYGYLRVLMEGEEILIYRYRYERYLQSLRFRIYSATQHPTCFVRREVYQKIGVFDVQFSVAADHDFLLRASKAGVKFLAVDRVIANFTAGGVSQQMDDHELHRQRYEVLNKNGMISEEEYRKAQRELAYKKYSKVKKKIAGWLFRT